MRADKCSIALSLGAAFDGAPSVEAGAKVCEAGEGGLRGLGAARAIGGRAGAAADGGTGAAMAR